MMCPAPASGAGSAALASPTQYGMSILRIIQSAEEGRRFYRRLKYKPGHVKANGQPNMMARGDVIRYCLPDRGSADTYREQQEPTGYARLILPDHVNNGPFVDKGCCFRGDHHWAAPCCALTSRGPPISYNRRRVFCGDAPHH